jgi:microcystin-dependent protein
MAWYNWSQTAASNATADPSINWAEGQSPSSINDSARAMMAATAKYRDDIAGALITSGTSTAYTISSYSQYDTMAHLNGQMIAFTPNVTNTVASTSPAVTLNVDSLGAYPLRTAPGVDIPAGTLIQGTPYVATFSQVNLEFYLRGFYGNPYNVPLLAGFDFWGTTAPNSAFIFPAGQAISRTTYATAFAIMGTTYGSGDGSTTFNVPDKTERVSVMKAAASIRLPSIYFGGNSAAMGAVGGTASQTLALGHLPTGITANENGVAVTVYPAGNSAYFAPIATTINFVGVAPGGGGDIPNFGGSGFVSNAFSGTINVGTTSNNTGSQASGGALNVPIVPPTIVCNYIIRII